MIICRVGPSRIIPQFARPVFELTRLQRLPPGPLVEDRAGWSERRLECSLLRQPELLASLVDPRLTAKPAAARQVLKVDLVLRFGGALHLLELKKPNQHLQFRSAANQIVRQWLAARG